MNQEILGKIEKGKVYAIIPARSGSKGVPNKNIKCLNGFPMLAYSIAACRMCSGIDRILVTTDSAYYAEIARYYGAEAPFLRPAEISGDHATDIEFMRHAISWLGEHENRIPEYFVHIRPTYPLRDIGVVEKAIDLFVADKNATSLRSAHLSSAMPYKWFNLQDGYFTPIWGSMTPDEANNPRQAFPDVYIPDGYVDVLSSEFIIKNDLMHGNKVLGYVVPDGVDVDVMKDMAAVEVFLRDNTHPVYEYLRDNYKTLEEWEQE